MAHNPSSKLGVKRLPEATLISTRIFGGTLIGSDEQVHWRSDKQLKSSWIDLMLILCRMITRDLEDAWGNTSKHKFGI